jgi:uncharacterized protein YcbX
MCGLFGRFAGGIAAWAKLEQAMTALTVKEIWRYPVKSMRGEMLDRAAVGFGGIPGDRIWVVRGAQGGMIPDRKNALAGLLDCAARYDAATDDVEITLPDGKRIILNENTKGNVAAALAPLVDTPAISLWRAGPLRHESVAADVDPASVEKAIRRVFGIQPTDATFPDFVTYPVRALQAAMHSLTRYQRRAEVGDVLGFDFFPMNVLTEASLRHLEAAVTHAPIDRRRFRPNIFVQDDAGLAQPLEQAWEGREIAVGAARLFSIMRCVRCVMPSLPQGGQGANLPRDTVFNPANTPAMHVVGTYPVVLTEGRIALGDTVRVPTV